MDDLNTSHRNSIGRPVEQRPKMIVRLTLTLYYGQDDDLIAFYEQAPPRQRARATMAAMRAGGVQAVQEHFQQDEAELAEAIDDFLF